MAQRCCCSLPRLPSPSLSPSRGAPAAVPGSGSARRGVRRAGAPPAAAADIAAPPFLPPPAPAGGGAERVTQKAAEEAELSKEDGKKRRCEEARAAYIALRGELDLAMKMIQRT